MREHKYIAWDKEKKRMSKPMPIYTPIITWSDGDIEMPTDFALLKGRCVWRQFTGLQDKNGTDIYEKDIVETAYGFGRGVVEFHRCWFEIAGLSDIESPSDCLLGNYLSENIEIIGNCYQNPELLEVEA